MDSISKQSYYVLKGVGNDTGNKRTASQKQQREHESVSANQNYTTYSLIAMAHSEGDSSDNRAGPDRIGKTGQTGNHESPETNFLGDAGAGGKDYPDDSL